LSAAAHNWTGAAQRRQFHSTGQEVICQWSKSNRDPDPQPLWR